MTTKSVNVEDRHQ